MSPHPNGPRPVIALLALLPACAAPSSFASAPVVLVADGGWCWFQDERAVTVNDRYVVFGSVAGGREEPARAGDVQASRWDLETGKVETFVLHAGLNRDDHAAPTLLPRGDGRLLAVYCSHGHDDVLRWRHGDAGGAVLAFGDEQTWTVPMRRGNGLCYSNLFDLGGGTLVDCCRAENWNPTALVSRDGGGSWQLAQRLVGGPGRPYAKYAGDAERVHFVCTEQHPRDFDNGLWHGSFTAADLVVGDTDEPPAPADLTPIFAGRADAVAWPCDLELDAEGRPHCVFSVQVDGAGKPRGQGGLDHRFWYARHDGERWLSREIAFAGTRLYAGEDDYTGLCCLVPDEPSVVVISTDADPVTGAALISTADGRRHRELFLGRTRDDGASWTWQPLTADSTADNLRPTVPRWRAGRCVVLWTRGVLRSYTDYDLEVVGQIVDLQR
ncbi:MAG: BNR-4 repeat-containing protein [Planctomycetes bacterium]|nr:BNR-4 repeat-containing protein [Planctomycetota bacterium]